MSNSIIIISTTTLLTKRIKKVLKEMNKEEMPIYEVVMDRALSLARENIKLGTKVIICRGGTSEYLRENVDVPVVDIRHGFLDIYRSFKKLEGKYNKIGLLGFKNLCEAGRNFNAVTGNKLLIFEVNNKSEFESEFKNALKSGVEVLIGGFQLRDMCKENNIPFFHGESDELSIKQSLMEAMHNLKIEKERRKEYKIINGVLNSASDGIIGVNESGEILYINTVAKLILGINSKKNIKDVFPTKNIFKTINHKESYYNDLINFNEKSLVISSVPIMLEGDSIGAAITIQEEKRIQSLERKIRKKHFKNGYIAKKNFNDVIGCSEEIKKVKRQAKKYALSESTILITGESGTGKEVFAQSIHNYSDRKSGPFVAINCAALPQNILESELFGYVKGAFTGANKEGKEGIFELGDKGTIFLDEISEISLDVQAKLLRVIEEKEINRLGDDKIIPIDVRIITASNKNLTKEVSLKKFREDLYYRICVLELDLPPLRSRQDDVEELFIYLLSKRGNIPINKITSGAIRILKDYKWPGNVRQLSNIVERLEAVYNDGMINTKLIKDLLDKVVLSEELERKKENVKGSSIDSFKSDLLIRQEIETMEKVLSKTNGNRTKTAAILGISTTTLWRKMKKYELENY